MYTVAAFAVGVYFSVHNHVIACVASVFESSQYQIINYIHRSRLHGWRVLPIILCHVTACVVGDLFTYVLLQFTTYFFLSENL